MKKTTKLLLALIGILTLTAGCLTLKHKQTPTPPPPPDPATIINSPEFIAKNGFIVRDVPYPPKKVWTLKEKIDEADIVVEAKAVERRTFNKTSADSVRTSYLLVVYKVFKGNIKTDTIELTVKGGFYDYIEPDEEYIPGIPNPLAGQKITSFAQGQTFALNQYGTFFLKRNPQPEQQSAFKQIPNQYKFTAQWHRNYLWYEFGLDVVGDFDIEYNSTRLERHYKSIQQITKKKYKERVPLYKKKGHAEKANKQADEQLVMTITGFSKDSIPAGTQTNLSHLSIYGSGFGADKGRIRFKNANTGGANEVTISAKDILYWSNDSIKVHVPSMGDTTQLDRCAGSGVVKIVRTDNPSDSVTSTMGIIVPYSIKNTYTEDDYYRPKLRGVHNGGYTVVYDSSFYNNKPALAAFRRALQRWRCTTGINLQEYCEKARPFCDTLGQTGFIRVGFAKNCFGFTGQPIYLGATTIRKVQSCISTDTTLYVLAQDLIFADPPDAGFTWHYDSIPSNASNKYDFETTALHELGHVHLLGHVTDATKNMYYGQPTCNQVNSTIRTLSPLCEIAGGNFIMGQDTIANPNCPTYAPMQTIANCLLPDVCPPSGTCSVEDPSLFNQPILTTTCPLPIALVPTAGGQFGVLASTAIQISASHPYNAAYTYEWDFGEGATILSGTSTSDYGPHEVMWETTGLRFITLTVYNNDHCYGVAETVWVNNWQDCSNVLEDTFVSNIVQPTCSLPQGSFMLANNPSVGTLCYYYTITRNDTLIYEGNGTGSPLLFSDLLPGIYMVSVEDHISGCLSYEQVIINEVLAGSGKTQDDETLCFIDLRMRDNEWDTGQEPNYSAGIDADGNGWQIDSPVDWEAIWNSPDLWNCRNGDNCTANAQDTPYEIYTNKMGFTIHNAHPSIISDPALLHLYYTMGSTGEMWDITWIDNFYFNSLGDGTCRVGDELVNSPVNIPAIDPLSSYTGWRTWSPPNFTNTTIDQYVNPATCGLSPETDPADGELKYEICLLARIESAQDPIVGEQNPAPIRDNILNSNNIVTNNYFIPIVGQGPGGGLPPIVPGKPSVILVANNNSVPKNLDILLEKITQEPSAGLQELLEVSIVLSPDLWQKWESTGKQGEGVQIIAEREVKITNLETAKLLNIPFDANEFQPIAIKLTLITGSGKQQNLPNLPDKYGFRITHLSSNQSPINKPSNCLFTVNNLPGKIQSAQALPDMFTCSPNPFRQDVACSFYLHQPQPISIYLYDIRGSLVKTVLHQQPFNAGKHQITVPAGNLPPGMYIAVLQSPHKQLTQKVFKIN